jgi:predicted DNA-binding protein (MmcQ/YjbR family)
MNTEQLRKYCLAKKSVTEDFPFDDKILAFRIAKKIFLLTSYEKPLSMNLKADPELAIEFRKKFIGEVTPGYHMNKKHWNSVLLQGKIPVKDLKMMIDHSYEQVLQSLTKKERDEVLSSG